MNKTIVQKWFDDAGHRARNLPMLKPEHTVLIAAPIAGHKQYSMDHWLDWISRQDHANVEIALCPNGDAQEAITKKLAETKVTHISGRPIRIHAVKMGRPDEKMTLLERLVHARERLRGFAVSNGYDAVLWLDTDTIPLRMDSIKELFKAKADAASGLYFYKNTGVPVACDTETGTNFDPKKIEEAVKTQTLMQASVGFGCVLMRGKALQINFRYRDEAKSDDFVWCENAAQAGIPVWLAPWVLCKHLRDKI